MPYLTAPPTGFRLAGWLAAGAKVGFVWAGEPKHRDDRRRSMPLRHFERLARIPGLQWHSLQVGPQISELARLGLTEVNELGSKFRDFGDTAEAIAQLDLVISVDTSVAHLAGALGKPVWTLLPFASEWRWMRTGAHPVCTRPCASSVNPCRQHGTSYWSVSDTSWLSWQGPRSRIPPPNSR